MPTKPPLRVRSLVLKALENTSVNRLASEINRVNTEAETGCRVANCLLRNLRDNPEAIGLTWAHLVAFHTYFKDRGGNLQHVPILETRGIFEALDERHRLVFMYGAKPRPEEQRTDNSHWDTRAHVELVRQASLAGWHQQIEAQDVLWRSPVDQAAFGSEPWSRILDEDQASVISIGSPLAALSSEIMLARMFDVKPFVPPHVTAKRVPFFFVWLHKSLGDFRSAFGLTHLDLQADHPELARRVRENATTAVLLGDQILESPTTANEWTMYGIIAAQRRAAGNVWLVVSGLHGPATFGAATIVKEITEELPWSSKGPGKVLWVSVKVTVRAGTAKPTDGDIRVVTGAEFDGKPGIWRLELEPSAAGQGRPARTR